MAKGLRFTVGVAVYHSVLMENPLAEKIAAMCPFELNYSRNGKASDCIKCGKCEHACPQHLNIRELLTDVTAEFERR